MKRIDLRILLGAGLILGGALLLLETMGILAGASRYLWAGILAIGAAIFLSWFFGMPDRWWAAIPGFALAGMCLATFLNSGWSDLASQGGLGAGFLAIYIANRKRWWAIIPGGVLLSVGISSAVSTIFPSWQAQSGGIFMLCLGLTFLLLAVLEKRRWAYITAAALLVAAVFLMQSLSPGMDYAWIAILLLAGLVLVISAFRSR